MLPPLTPIFSPLINRFFLEINKSKLFAISTGLHILPIKFESFCFSQNSED